MGIISVIPQILLPFSPSPTPEQEPARDSPTEATIPKGNRGNPEKPKIGLFYISILSICSGFNRNFLLSQQLYHIWEKNLKSSVTVCNLVDSVFFPCSFFLQYMDQNSRHARSNTLNIPLFSPASGLVAEVISPTIPASKKLIRDQGYFGAMQGFLLTKVRVSPICWLKPVTISHGYF